MSAWTKIARTVVGASGAPTIVFSTIPASFTDLMLFCSFRTSSVGSYAGFTFNGTTSGYGGRLLFGSGSGNAATTEHATNEIQYFETNDSTQTANTFNNGFLFMPNYNSSSNKLVSYDVVNENNAVSAQQRILAGFWNNNAAISSITIDSLTGDFVQYSSATLYGITRGSSGGVTVS
jgi:hypothetical protein